MEEAVQKWEHAHVTLAFDADAMPLTVSVTTLAPEPRGIESGSVYQENLNLSASGASVHDTFRQTVADLGGEGWEMVSFSTQVAPLGAVWHVWFKRPEEAE
jgi:hypothetical protein